MISKANVKYIRLVNGAGHRWFIVSGIDAMGLSHQKRHYKNYSLALAYSLKLQDYYQAPVVEVNW